MKPLQLWIKIIDAGDVSRENTGLKPDDLKWLNDVVAQGSKRLKNYFTRILAAMPKQAYNGVKIGVNPTSSDIGIKDLLVHVTSSSLTLAVARQNNLTVLGATGHAGGRTGDFASGVLSEIFWPNVRNSSRKLDEQGIALANLTIHEWAHNKTERWTGPNRPDVHASGGPLGTGLTAGALRGLDLSNANVKFMAAVVGRDVPQYPFWLFSDEAGF